MRGVTNLIEATLCDACRASTSRLELRAAGAAGPLVYSVERVVSLDDRSGAEMAAKTVRHGLPTTL
jgi:hypothetical protein